MANKNNAHHPDEKTRRMVESMSGYGIGQIDIARVVGCTEKTLRKHYREELDTAETKANAKVAESLFKKALGDKNGSVTAAIFWLKTRAGWTEKSVVDNTSSDRSMSPAGPAQDAAIAAMNRKHCDPE